MSLAEKEELTPSELKNAYLESRFGPKNSVPVNDVIFLSKKIRWIK